MTRTSPQQPSHRVDYAVGRACRARRGFSLLEVVFASAILLGAVVVLGELAHMGIRNAAAARDLTTAEFICRNTLNEITAGILPTEEVENAVVTSTPGWVYSVELIPLEYPGTTALRVTVAEDLPEEQEPLTFSLVRWIPTSPNGNSSLNLGGSGLGNAGIGGSGYSNGSVSGLGTSRGGP